MSEENQESNEGKIVISANPENSKRIKDAFMDAKMVQEANRTLLQQKEELTQKVEKYEKLIEDAKREATEKHVIDRFISPPPAPVGGDTAPLNPSSDNEHTYKLENDENCDLNWMQFDSEQELYETVAKKARSGNKQAQAIEKQILKKMGHNWEIELVTDDSKCLYRSEKPITDDLPENEKRRRMKFNQELKAKRSNWRLV